MSKETLDDLIYDLLESTQEEFPDYLERVLYFGFLDDIELADLLDIELDDLDELLSTAQHITLAEWRAYRAALVRKLKREQKRYETLYYSDKKAP